MSPVLVGRRMVLDSLARLEKADTYCSATVRDAAAFPFCAVDIKMMRVNRDVSKRVYLVKEQPLVVTCSDRASDRMRIAFDFASALAKTACASPGGNTAIKW